MTPAFLMVAGFMVNMAVATILWLYVGVFAGILWSGVAFGLGLMLCLATGYYDQKMAEREDRKWDTTTRT